MTSITQIKQNKSFPTENDIKNHISAEAVLNKSSKPLLVVAKFFSQQYNKEIWYESEELLDKWLRHKTENTTPLKSLSFYLSEKRPKDKEISLKLLDTITDIHSLQKSSAYKYVLATKAPKIRPSDLITRISSTVELLLESYNNKENTQLTTLLINQLYETIYLSFPLANNSELPSITSSLEETLQKNTPNKLREKVILITKVLDYAQNQVVIFKDIPKSAFDTKLGVLLTAELYYFGLNALKKNTKLAKEHYKLVLETDPKCFMAHRRLGEISLTKSYRTTSLPKAKQHFINACTIFPSSKPTLLNLSKIYFDYSKYTKSQEYLEKALALRPLDLETIKFTLDFAAHCFHTEKSTDARKYLDIVISADPSNKPTSNMLLDLATAHYDYKELKKSKKYLDKALAILPLDKETIQFTIEFAIHYFEEEDFETAEKYLDQAILADPTNKNLFTLIVHLAAACFNNDEIEKAEKYLDQAIRIDPTNRTLLELVIHSANKCFNNGEIEKAKKYSDVAQKIDPLNSDTMTLAIQLDNTSDTESEEVSEGEELSLSAFLREPVTKPVHKK